MLMGAVAKSFAPLGTTALCAKYTWPGHIVPIPYPCRSPHVGQESSTSTIIQDNPCAFTINCAQVSPRNCLVSSILYMRPVMQLPFTVHLLISTFLPSTSNCCTWLAHIKNLRSLTQIGSMSCLEVFLKPLSALNLSNLQSLKISSLNAIQQE